MTEDDREVLEAIAGMMGVAPDEIDRERELGTEREDVSEGDGEITVEANCPDCGEPMSIVTVVSQEDRDRNGRSRYEAVCTDCQMGMILTVMQSVGSYEDLFGFEAPERDWDIDALGQPYVEPEADKRE